jgi:DNA polymerase-3 subunit delta
MPNIDVAALQKQIATRRLGAIYLLVGEDVKLIERLVDGIEATVDEADRAFAIDRLYAGDAGGTPVEIIASARGLPMLGDRRIVIVLRAERLLKPKRAGKAAVLGDADEDAASGTEAAVADLAPIEEYLADPVPSTTLVFVATDVDRSRRLTKRLVATAQVVECFGLRAGGPAGRREARGAALEWLREELARGGKAIAPDALHLLVDRGGADITRLRGDVERLLLYAEGRKTISYDDVDEVASTQVSVDDDWAVVNAIADGDAARALGAAGQRLERGDSPHALVGQLRWWVSSRLAEGDPTRVKPALEALLRTDLALKSSASDERVLIERLVVELTGKAVAQRRSWERS